MITMVTGIVIPHEIRVAVFEHQFGALADYQAAVGRYVEPVYLADANLTIYANEEGKVRQLPANRRATCLWWFLYPETRGRDILVGDVVLIGSTRGHGSTTALPDFLTRQLQHPGRFTIEVRTNDDPAHWYDNGRNFDDYFEAAIVAINLQERWSQVREMRVSPA
ncbi:hypothetical protein BHD05_05290 [Marisediminicola antarctica]|uniref:DUF3846 domain-containing protein n=2 Tax=Marisediminicola antarctica TaxID=674079 RepID=A0A7L5AFB6_9MICO|nr:hypothetical protein BHD05_05290 [Marisediminicola antarctica]